MLDTFRKHSNSTLIYLIFGALIFVFVVSFGQGSQGFKAGSITGSAEYAARVNEETISVSDFQRQYRNMLASFEQRAGQQIPDDMADQLGLKKQALDNLVNQKLLVQAAHQRGLHVGDEELAKAIQAVPAFQKDGVFDKDTYLKILQYQGLDAPTFEDREREDLLVQKMVALISSSAMVTDAEVRAEFDKEHDRADVTFVRFSPASFMDQVTQKPTDAELDTYIAAHQKEVQDFYQRNGYRYHKPQRYQAKDILVKAPEGSDADADKAAKAKADQAYQALKGGKDFGAVAKEFSDDTATKDKGGEMGVFSPASMDKHLEEAVSKLQPGQYSEPVKTRFGYQIIEVEKVIPAENQSLDEVKKDIAGELIKTEAARALAQQKAAEALKAAQDGKALTDLYPASTKTDDAFQFGAASSKPEAQDSGPFPAGDFVPKIGPAADIAAAAFALDKPGQAAPKVFQESNAFYVVQLKTREKPNDADFAKDKEELRQALLQRRQNDLLQGFLKELREAGKVEENQALTLPANPSAPS